MVDGVEIDDDVKFQRRVWTAQRVGWVIVGSVIAASLAGLFGTGPVSRASAELAGLRLEYERFGRLQQPTKLRFFISGAQPEIQIALGRDYLDSVRVEAITPAPLRTEADGRWLVYRFAGAAPMSVTFNLNPEDFGGLSGMLRTPSGETITFRQFIYP